MTDDLLKRAEPFLNQCGSCDGGLPQSCTCPTADFRPVMLDLVREIVRLRREHEPRRGSDVDAWIKQWRDSYQRYEDRAWDVIDMMLDDYRNHSDTGTPLSETVAGPHPEEGR